MILDTIAAATKKRVEAAKTAMPLEEVKIRALALPKKPNSFETALRKQGVSLICEIKKASPSKGLIAQQFAPVETARAYEAGGAAAISVLTEPEFFLGSDAYLTAVKKAVSLPVLRKDFTVDEYQLYEAKVLGADAVLLICALLDTQTIRRYLDICSALSLGALVEAHTQAEVESALSAGARIVGVNNRNLKTFEVSLDTCLKLRPLVPHDTLFVAESGIRTAADIALLREANVDAALIGEMLMRSEDIDAALADLREAAL